MPPADLAPLVLDATRAIDPDLTFFLVRTLEQLLADRRGETRLFAFLLTVLAAVGLFYSALGLYAITAHAVTLRTRELGLRVALGARASQIRGLVVRQAFWQLGLGVAGGLAGALAVGQVLRSQLHGTSPTDLATLLAVIAILGTVALVACLVPARRAAAVDPVVALRHE